MTNEEWSKRMGNAIRSALLYGVGLMVFLGIGAFLSKDTLNIPWLLKAGALGAVIGFVVAIFSKGGKLFE